MARHVAGALGYLVDGQLYDVASSGSLQHFGRFRLYRELPSSREAKAIHGRRFPRSQAWLVETTFVDQPPLHIPSPVGDTRGLWMSLGKYREMRSERAACSRIGWFMHVPAYCYSFDERPRRDGMCPRDQKYFWKPTLRPEIDEPNEQLKADH
eukprot:5562479-Prymnesium_polylepis.1